MRGLTGRWRFIRTHGQKSPVPIPACVHREGPGAREGQLLSGAPAARAPMPGSLDTGQARGAADSPGHWGPRDTSRHMCSDLSSTHEQEMRSLA